jgi:hypothetical protein
MRDIYLSTMSLNYMSVYLHQRYYYYDVFFNQSVYVFKVLIFLLLSGILFVQPDNDHDILKEDD